MLSNAENWVREQKLSIGFGNMNVISDPNKNSFKAWYGWKPAGVSWRVNGNSGETTDQNHYKILFLETFTYAGWTAATLICTNGWVFKKQNGNSQVLEIYIRIKSIRTRADFVVILDARRGCLNHLEAWVLISMREQNMRP